MGRVIPVLLGCWVWPSPWRFGRTGAAREKHRRPMPRRRPTTTTPVPCWHNCPSRAGTAAPTSSVTGFGESWSDDVNVELGHNGCNTRDDILRRDLTELMVRAGTCFAQTGVLHDAYTGESIAFVRGPDTSDAVQIDHYVSVVATVVGV